MKNFLTILALGISLSGIAASVLREEMRCYVGLASQSCPTSEKPTLPVSLPQENSKKQAKPSQPLTQPKAVETSPEKPVISQPEQTIASPKPPESSPAIPSQPVEAVRNLDPNPPLRKLPVSVEDLKKIGREASKNTETAPTESGIPLSVESHESSSE